jgi:hypothetical protein
LLGTHCASRRRRDAFHRVNRGRIVNRRTGHKRLNFRPVRAATENIRLPVAIALGREKHALSVGGEAGVVLEQWVLQQFSFAGSIGICDVQVGGGRSNSVHK